MRSRGGLLRHRDFRLLWIGETTSSLGSSVTSVALPLVAITNLHASVFAIGMLSAAAWLPWLLIGLPAGAWIDRMPRRPVMLVCDLVSLTLFASVPVAAWLGLLTLPQLLGVALLTGTSKVFFATAYRAYLPSLVAAGRSGRGQRQAAGQRVGRADRGSRARRAARPGVRCRNGIAGRRRELPGLGVVPALDSRSRDAPRDGAAPPAS